MLSRLATEGMTPAFRGALAKGLRLVLFLTLPCAVGLSLLSHEIISVIFEHGKFTAHDVANTAAPLQAYAFGLIFYAAIKVLQLTNNNTLEREKISQVVEMIEEKMAEEMTEEEEIAKKVVEILIKNK